MPSTKKPTPKKRGRPALAKKHVKSNIVPMRLKDEDLKLFSKAAQSNKLTLSEWMRSAGRTHTEPAWDERLDQHGIDTVLWPGAGDGHKKILDIVFKETTTDPKWGVDRLSIKQELIATKDHDHYRAASYHHELTKRGIEKVWVTTTKNPFWRSSIHFKFADLPHPITIVMRY